ncbi:hypothetical protein D8674_011470 [Pyrus ussuriensis x Pyrus communis]|uniref:Uncharacterized protein n=1 Tax=Pyrus ussuriensis x Pyrus communis TaxID=2448454 RepID=A0A5N5G4F2_9ROSA|nr:hypothetical protein D8674_011470 [Pyrus ussuriensis x Pyrus communis]
MVDSGGPSLKRVHDEGSEKDKKKKRDATCIRYTSSAKSRYRITYTELVGFEKLDMVKKFRDDVRTLRRPQGDRDGHGRCCNYTLDDTNKELMKLMEEALKRGYKQRCYDVEWNGGPPEQ